MPVSHSIQAEVSTTRKGPAISSAVLAVTVAVPARILGDTGQLIPFEDRYHQDTFTLGNEHELLPCLPMLFFAHGLGDGDPELA